MHVIGDQPPREAPLAIGTAAILVEIAHRQQVFDTLAGVLSIGHAVQRQRIDLAMRHIARHADQVVANMVAAIGDVRQSLGQIVAKPRRIAVIAVAMGVGGILGVEVA